MTKAETFAILKQAFGLDSVLKKYDSVAPLDGLKESLKYWDWAKEAQEKTPSDGRWWEYENEKTLAYVLMGMFCWRLLGHDDYPSLPGASPEVRMDPHLPVVEESDPGSRPPVGEPWRDTRVRCLWRASV
ncbi:MAG: hypothetical protein LUO86_06685 [Methanomicrobiales archaeon]|nr:hypothetical protein [Methanomicrobiales archaeon]